VSDEETGPRYTVEYFAGGTWLRVSKNGTVVFQGDSKHSAWVVADVLTSLGHSVEVRPAPGGSYSERDAPTPPVKTWPPTMTSRSSSPIRWTLGSSTIALLDGDRRRFPPSHPRAAQVVAPGTRELIEDLAALREEAPGFLGAGEEERAEPELVAQPPGADQIAVRDQASERE